MKINRIPSFGLMIISIAYVVEITTFPLILSGLSADFGLSNQTAQLLVSSYKIALVASILIAGWAGDTFSREGVFTLGTVIFSASSFAMLFVTDSNHLLPLRVAQGIGAGLFSPMIPALLASRRPAGALAALGHWGMITGAAAAVYPFIAAYLTEENGWQAGWVIVPLCAVLALTGLPKPSDSKTPETTPTGPTEKVKLGLKVWAIMGYVFVNYGLTTWFIVALALAAGPETYSIKIAGTILFILWSVFSLTNFLIAKYGSALRSVWALSIGIVLNSSAVCGFVCFANNPVALAVSGVFLGIGMGLNNAPTTHMAFKLTPPSAHGRVASLDIIAARLGGAFSVLIIPSSGPYGVWAAFAALLLSSAFIFIACRNPLARQVSKTQLVP